MILGLALLLPATASASPAGQNRILVVTTTDDSTTQAGLAAINAAGKQAGFSVTAPTPKQVSTQFTAKNLDRYGAVVFLDTGVSVPLTGAQRSAFEDYINAGGGFVGIGSAAETNPDWAFLSSLLVTRPDPSSSSDQTAQDVEFLDRVNPASRNLPALVKGHQDEWYKWATNPTGSVQTVARARFASIPTESQFSNANVPSYVTQTHIVDEGQSVTDDAVKDDSSGSNPNNNSDRPVSWCLDVGPGRSFYTAMGRTTAAYSSDTLQVELAGAIQWAAGMVQGNCKATITKNYTATRLTPPDSSGPGGLTGHDYIGESTHMDIASDGRVFYIGRAACSESDRGTNDNWGSADSPPSPTVGLGCGTIHVWDPRGPGSDDQNPDRIHLVASLDVFGNRGGGSEVAPNGKSEEGLVGIALDPQFTQGRPFIYIDWFPYFSSDKGPGFQRYNFMTERRISRFTYDENSHSLLPGSEKVLLHWMTQAYACCHTGGSLDFDSQGNLYIPTGDMTGNNPNGASGGYQNGFTNYTIPAGTPDHIAYGLCSLNDHLTNPDCYGGLVAFADARQTSGNNNSLDGKLIRIHPMANPGATPALAPNDPGSPIPAGGPSAWGLGSTYTVPGADAPNGPNMFAPDSPEVQQGLAKPEIYSMGLRNFYSVKLDPKTDLVTAAMVGPDQATPNDTWGAEGMDVMTLLPHAGNYNGWPYCQGDGLDFRKKLAGPAPGVPAPVGTQATIPGPPYDANGQPTGGWIDCRHPILNDSPFNTGLQLVPAPLPVNFWFGHPNDSGCPDYRRDQNMLPFNFADQTPAQGGERFERCPWLVKNGGGGDEVMTGGIYRVPATADPDTAWPAYWDGRWFVINGNGLNSAVHAVLLPDHPDSSSNAVAADNLRAILSKTNPNIQALGEQFGPDGSLYVLNYGTGFFAIQDATALWRISYTGGGPTPGPDPQASASAGSSTVQFSPGDSGGVSYHWDFGDGTTSDAASPTHTYKQAGDATATLTVTYADGGKASKKVKVTT